MGSIQMSRLILRIKVGVSVFKSYVIFDTLLGF
jgi:hypothetical protein